MSTSAAYTSLITDVRFDALHQLWGHLPDAMFLGMLSRLLEYLGVLSTRPPYTLGGFIHLLLVIAVVVLVIRLMQGRPAAL